MAGKFGFLVLALSYFALFAAASPIPGPATGVKEGHPLVDGFSPVLPMEIAPSTEIAPSPAPIMKRNFWKKFIWDLKLFDETMICSMTIFLWCPDVGPMKAPGIEPPKTQPDFDPKHPYPYPKPGQHHKRWSWKDNFNKYNSRMADLELCLLSIGKVCPTGSNVMAPVLYILQQIALEKASKMSPEELKQAAAKLVLQDTQVCQQYGQKPGCPQGPLAQQKRLLDQMRGGSSVRREVSQDDGELQDAVEGAMDATTTKTPILASAILPPPPALIRPYGPYLPPAVLKDILSAILGNSSSSTATTPVPPPSDGSTTAAAARTTAPPMLPLPFFPGPMPGPIIMDTFVSIVITTAAKPLKISNATTGAKTTETPIDLSSFFIPPIRGPTVKSGFDVSIVSDTTTTTATSKPPKVSTTTIAKTTEALNFEAQYLSKLWPLPVGTPIEISSGLLILPSSTAATTTAKPSEAHRPKIFDVRSTVTQASQPTAMRRSDVDDVRFTETHIPTTPLRRRWAIETAFSPIFTTVTYTPRDDENWWETQQERPPRTTSDPGFLRKLFTTMSFTM